MGWFFSDISDHEGYAVGFVTLEKDGRKIDGLYRELGYADDDVVPIVKMSAACECGWRSSRWRPMPWHENDAYKMPDFSPHIVFVSPEDEERAHALWLEHVRQEERK